MDLPDIIKKELKKLKLFSLLFVQWKAKARTKLTARKNYNLKRNNFEIRRSPQQRPRPRPRVGIGVKSIENRRRRNKDIKIKKLLAQTKSIPVKHRGQVVRRMTVRCKSISPAQL